MIALLLSTLLAFADSAPQAIVLTPGFVTKVRCEGRLLLSSIGEPTLVQLEALPQSIGCGVILKPLTKSGRTNLILETSTGSIQVFVEISVQRDAGKNGLEVSLRSRQ